MQSHLIISLNLFPQQPISISKQNKQIYVTPRTTKILNQAKVKLYQILPYNIATFIRINNLQDQTSQYIREIYQLQQSRRINKLQILKQLWKKQCNLKIPMSLDKIQKFHKSKSSKKENKLSRVQSVYLHVPKSLANSRFSSGRSSSVISSYLKDSRNTQLLKPKNKNRKKSIHNKFYDQYYTKNSGKKSIQDQSTKSRPNIHKLTSKYSKGYQQAPRPQYFTGQQNFIKISAKIRKNKKRQSINKIKSPSKKKDKSIQIYQNLFQLMSKWDRLDKKHENQIERTRGVSQIQRKRLQRLQKIQKDYFRQEVQSFKKQFRSKTNY